MSVAERKTVRFVYVISDSVSKELPLPRTISGQIINREYESTGITLDGNEHTDYMLKGIHEYELSWNLSAYWLSIIESMHHSGIVTMRVYDEYFGTYNSSDSTRWYESQFKVTDLQKQLLAQRTTGQPVAYSTAVSSSSVWDVSLTLREVARNDG
jgi:hypothetical protein